jgi:hypothetical protein
MIKILVGSILTYFVSQSIFLLKRREMDKTEAKTLSLKRWRAIRKDWKDVHTRNQ